MPRIAFLRTILVALGLMVAAASTANAYVVIKINQATQKMTVSVDGRLRYTWPVSTGKPGYATPNGSFRVFRTEKTYFSKEWDDAPMPYTMFFTPQGNAIHGTLATGDLGRPVSHGCVRLAPQNAATLFALVKSAGLFGARVIVTGPETSRPKDCAA